MADGSSLSEVAAGTAKVIDPLDLHIGRRIRRRRRLLGLTLKELAERANVSFQQLQKHEAGRNRLYAAGLGRLAQVLGVTPDYFYQRSGLFADAGEEPPAVGESARRLIAAHEKLGEARGTKLVELAEALAGEP